MISSHEQSGLPDLNNPVDQNGVPKSRLENVFELFNNIIRTDRDFNIKDTFSVDDSEYKVSIGHRFNRIPFAATASSAVYSVLRKDYCIGITSLAFAPTIGLPVPRDAGSGKTYLIKDEAGGATTTTITISCLEPASIEGILSTTIATNYGSKMFYTDGNQWFVGLT